jgi:pimeloyl-ACP methyl ester carboxylesterase
MNKNIVRALVSTAALLALGFAAHTPTTKAQDDAVEGSYASVNGLEMYYEIHGEGQPLILLHGGLGGIAEFSALLPLLAESYQVIAVELQAHGHTADIDRSLSFEAMADDVAALIGQLGYKNADILGFSLGGGVALQTAIRHPEVVRKLVLVSAAFRREGVHSEFLAGMEAMNPESAGQMLETPMYQFYASVAPRLEDWPTLVGKMGDLMRGDYDWSADVSKIAAPTLILAGDSDWIPPSYTAELYELLGGGVAGGFAPPSTNQLAILPNTIHFTILARADLLLPLINPFLDAPMPEATS